MHSNSLNRLVIKTPWPWLMLFTFSAVVLSLTATSPVMRTSAHISTTIEAPQSSCDCKDLVALLSRRREVSAAIAAIHKQTFQLEADERAAQKVFAYSDASYAKYYGDAIQQAIAAAHDRTTPQVNGPTNFTSDCTPTTSSANNPQCFWQGLAINEQVREKWCEGGKRGGGDIVTQALGGDRLGGLAGTWMGRYPIANFADVAEKGYLAELAYLKEKISELQNRCKFSRWSGEVIVTYSSQTKFSKSSPAPGAPTVPHQNRGTEDTTIRETEQVVITLVDGYASAEGTADYSIQKQSQSGPEIWCHASTQKNAFVPWSRSATEAYQISGPVYSGAAVNVGWPGDGTYNVSVHLPTGRGSGDSFSQATETGECAAKPVNNHYVVTDKSIGGFSVKGMGRAKQTDLTLDGSDQPKPGVISKDTSTDITVTWHLKRSRPQ